MSILIFDSIFVHRYKDSNDMIRAHCCTRLGDWLLQDPNRLCEEKQLKYLGWMCSDRSIIVRFEAVNAISKLCDV
jgi:cohesin complex subunit SA-1/2